MGVNVADRTTLPALASTSLVNVVAVSTTLSPATTFQVMIQAGIENHHHPMRWVYPLLVVLGILIALALVIWGTVLYHRAVHNAPVRRRRKSSSVAYAPAQQFASFAQQPDASVNGSA